MNAIAKCFVILLYCFIAAPAFAAEEVTVQAALEAVHGWYEALGNGSDQQHLKEFGVVGTGEGALLQAYQQLATELKQHMDRDQFLVHFRGLARMRLLQAHGLNTTAHENHVRVFVEEERTMAIEGVPVMAWFEGLIDVTKTQEGWKVSSIEDVKPEDIIDALRDGPAWHGDPVEIAMAHLQCRSVEDCSVIKKAFPPNSAERLGRVTIQTPHGVDTVSLARLHDGEWMPIDTEVEATGASK